MVKTSDLYKSIAEQLKRVDDEMKSLMDQHRRLQKIKEKLQGTLEEIGAPPEQNQEAKASANTPKGHTRPRRATHRTVRSDSGITDNVLSHIYRILASKPDTTCHYTEVFRDLQMLNVRVPGLRPMYNTGTIMSRSDKLERVGKGFYKLKES